MRQVAAIYVHVALTCTAPLCSTLWGLLASLHWALMLPQGRCGRLLLLPGILPVQFAGEQCVGGLVALLVQRPCAARLGVVIASPTRGRVSLRSDAAGAYICACRFDMYSASVRHALGFASFPSLGVDAPSGQMRQVVACLISYQCRLQVEGAKMDGAGRGRLMG